MAGQRSSVQGKSEEPAARRDLKPSKEVAAKMAPVCKGVIRRSVAACGERPSQQRASKEKLKIRFP